jgi:hypothetical protein
MNKYKCQSCGKYQYSSSSEKCNDPCIYCGHIGTDIVDEHECKEAGKEEKQ